MINNKNTHKTTETIETPNSLMSLPWKPKIFKHYRGLFGNLNVVLTTYKHYIKRERKDFFPVLKLLC